MLEGQCLCGRVRYVYHGVIEEIAMCHCGQCRLAQGGAFATNSPLDSSRLVFNGVEHIKEYTSSENKVRAFCCHCGSPLYSARADLPAVKRLRLGSVTSDFHCTDRYHIHVASCASWDSIEDEFPRHEAAKPA